MRGKPPVSPPVLWPAAVLLPARAASGRLSKATEARKAAATLCSPRRVAQLAPSAQEISA